jgi:hypothetical protein
MLGIKPATAYIMAAPSVSARGRRLSPRELKGTLAMTNDDSAKLPPVEYLNDDYEPVAQHKATLVRVGDIEYFTRVPDKAPPGRVIVHNHVMHNKRTRIGVNGFRAWTEPPGKARRELCDCGWRGLPHYRVIHVLDWN